MLAKKLMIVLSVVLASLALAQHAGVAGAKGRGVAVNNDQLHGSFNFEVRKAMRRNGEPVVDGKFVWEARIPSNNTAVRIEMPECREFAKDGDTAAFGGPAVMVVMRNNERHRFHGPLVVRVGDFKAKNSRPNSDRRDKISVSFRANESDVTYHFEGAVREGDIEVWMRRAD
ncbi:MAG: hypothetical protein KF784_04280 [Fimbriimonadaceae bacterium]|nr:hypothetical protein [Fimbriimonadaceae bacterium]